MKLRFMCATHREQISHNPKQAIYCWQNGFDTGLALVDDGLLNDAIPQLGCAFETAEILLSKGMVDAARAYEWLATSTILLGEALAKLGYAEQSLEIYLITIDRLERELMTSQHNYHCVLKHLKGLHRQIQMLDFCGPPIKTPDTATLTRATIH